MKKIKLLTIILAIVLVSIVAFVGVFVEAPNKIDNKVKEYTFASNLKGKRVVLLKISEEEDSSETEAIVIDSETGEQVSNESDESNTSVTNYSEDDYNIAKKTIENRLKFYGASDYTVALDKNTGTIKVELEEDDNTDYYVYKLIQPADFEIAKEDGTVLIDNSNIKSVKANYEYIDDGYQAYVEVKLDKAGKEKLAEISEKYAILATEIEEIENAKSADESSDTESSEEATEESSDTEISEESTSDVENTAEETTDTENTEESATESSEESTEKTYKEIVTLTIKNSTSSTTGTSYDVYEISKDKIKFLVGSSTTSETTLESNVETAYDLKGLLESGLYNIEYEESDEYIASSIQIKDVLISTIIFSVIILIALIVLIVKFKVNGLLSALSYVGQSAILMLLIRYANVDLSLEGLLAIVISAIVGYVLIYRMLKHIKEKLSIKEATAEAYKKTFVRLIPLLIVTIVACFTSWTSFVSFGLAMFWGIVIVAISNITLTKLMLKIKASK